MIQIKLSSIIRLLGVLLFIYLIYDANIISLSNIFISINLYYLFIGITLLFPIVFIRSMRWNYIKFTQNIKFSLKNSFLMYFASLYMGIVTPGRLGEFMKVRYLQHKNSFGKSFFSVFTDRLFDLLFLLLFGYIGLLMFSNIFQNQLIIRTYIPVSILIVFLSIFLIRKYFKVIIKKIFYKSIPKRLLAKAKLNIGEFCGGFKNLNHKNLFVLIFLTLLSWMIYFIQMNYLSKSLGVDLPFLTISLFVTITGLITMLPVSISGIGTRDLMMILFFSYYNLSKETAIAFSALILFMSLIAALIGFICLMIKPPK